MLPNVVILGAQKAATTFLQRGLEDHPEALVLPGETDTFFDSCYDPSAVERLAARFAGRQSRKVRVIKNAEYLTQEGIPPRLHAHLPDARLIAILREPVARYVSAYYHFIKYNDLPHVHHEAGIRNILEGEWSESYPRSKTLFDYGCYASGLKRFYGHFKKEQVLCLLHEDVASDSLGALKSVYRFLGIDESHRTSNLHRRSQAVVYSLPRLKILSLRRPLCFKRTEAGFRMRTGPLAKLAWYGGEFADRFLLSRIWANPRPELSIELRRKLTGLYRDEIDELEGLLGRDLSRWREPDKDPTRQT